MIPAEFRRRFLPYYLHPMTDAINAQHAADVAKHEAAERDAIASGDVTKLLARDSIFPRARAHTYLPVNRRYKPLGSPAQTGWVDYLTFPHLFVRFTVDPCTIKGVWFSSDGPDAATPGRQYLYYDNPESLTTLGERIGRLFHYLDVDWRDIRDERYRTRSEMRQKGLVGA